MLCNINMAECYVFASRLKLHVVTYHLYLAPECTSKIYMEFISRKSQCHEVIKIVFIVCSRKCVTRKYMKNSGIG